MSDDVQRERSLSDSVAEEIRVLLVRRRMSGRELARRLHVSPGWVSYRLTGVQPIDLNDLQRVADVLEVEVTALLPAATNRGRYRPEQHVVAVAGTARPARIRVYRGSPIAKPHIPGRSVTQTKPTTRVSL